MITTLTDSQQCYFDKYEEPVRHMTALMNASIVTLDLCPRILYPLWDAGLRTVKDLVRMHRDGLRNIPNIGVGAAAEIERIMLIADLFVPV